MSHLMAVFDMLAFARSFEQIVEAEMVENIGAGHHSPQRWYAHGGPAQEKRKDQRSYRATEGGDDGGLRKIYHGLFTEFGPQFWWPAANRFEMMIGAILTQNVAWTNVCLALEKMFAAEVVTAEDVLETPVEQLRELIHSTRYKRAKAEALQRLARWYLDYHTEDTDLEDWSDTRLRNSLLEVRGIGPETADCIMLYGFGRAVFVWDLYARRMLRAAGWAESRDYESARRQGQIRVDAAGFTLRELQEFHGLIVAAGKVATKTGQWLGVGAALYNQELVGR